MTELVEQGIPFYKLLVSALRHGNLFWHRERRRVRTVDRVESVTRVYFEPMEGEPDHLDFPQHGLDARQWAHKGDAVTFGQPRTLEELEAGWEHRDAAAAEGRPPY